MEDPVLITWLNDFVFCPRSIYFHNLYGDKDRLSFQETAQINGTDAHSSVDTGVYSTRKEILCGITVYSAQYDLIGKIDIYDGKSNTLIERKKKIKVVYDGYVFQLYGQCFAMRESGYKIDKLVLRSMDDNKNYQVALPEDDVEMYSKFAATVKALKEADISEQIQSNPEKCGNCIYEPLCDSSLAESR